MEFQSYRAVSGVRVFELFMFKVFLWLLGFRSQFSFEG